MARDKLLVCVLALACGGFTQPQVRAGNENLIAVYGVGTSSCGLWLEARSRESGGKDVRALQFHMWVDGYLSGYNWFFVRGGPGIYRTDVAGMKAFMDKYCRENPTRAFVAAANAFILDQGGTLPK